MFNLFIFGMYLITTKYEFERKSKIPLDEFINLSLYDKKWILHEAKSY